VANTYDASRLSFVSVPLWAAAPGSRDEALGPPSGHVWTRFGHGDLARVRRLNIPAMLWRMASRIAWARISGDYRNNPLFDPVSGKPIAAPRRLTPGERSALDLRAGLDAG
jgi:hypothetical protein